MTWYTDTCSIIAIGLLYKLTLGSVCGGALGPIVSWSMMQPFSMDGHYRTNVINGVGHLWSDSDVLLVLRTVWCVIAGTLALYYKSLRTASTLLRMGNISWVNHTIELWLLLYLSYAYIILYIYHLHDKLSSHNVACVL